MEDDLNGLIGTGKCGRERYDLGPHRQRYGHQKEYGEPASMEDVRGLEPDASEGGSSHGEDTRVWVSGVLWREGLGGSQGLP